MITRRLALICCMMTSGVWLASAGHSSNVDAFAPPPSPTVYGLAPTANINFAGGRWHITSAQTLFRVNTDVFGEDSELGQITLANGTPVYVTSIAVAPDGTMYAASDLSTLEDNPPAGLQADELYRVSLSPCCVATPIGSDSALVQQGDAITGMTFSPHGRLFATISHLISGDQLVQLDVTTGRVHATFAYLPPGYHFEGGLAFRPDNTLFTTVTCVNDVSVLCPGGTTPGFDGITTFISSDNYSTPHGYGADGSPNATLGFSGTSGLVFVGSDLYGAAGEDTATSSSPCPDMFNLIGIDQASDQGHLVRCTAVSHLTARPIAVPRKVVVFIPGIGTQLTNDDVTALNQVQAPTGCYDPTQFWYLHDTLYNSENFNCSDFLVFSYSMKSLGLARGWVPYPYTCTDTGQNVQMLAIKLVITLAEYHRAYPDSQFYLVGHSLGGLIAFDAAKIILDGDSFEALLGGVVTVDSPLNHTSAANYALLRAQGRLQAAGKLPCRASIPGINYEFSDPIPLLLFSTASNEIANNPENAAGTSDDDSVYLQANQALVKKGQAEGVSFMTVGNTQDCAWNLNACNLEGPWDDDSQTQVVPGAAGGLVSLGNQGCDVHGALTSSGVVGAVEGLMKLKCVSDSHGAALTDPGVVNSIATLIGPQDH